MLFQVLVWRGLVRKEYLVLLALNCDNHLLPTSPLTQQVLWRSHWHSQTYILMCHHSASLSKDAQIAHLLLEFQMERDKRAALENEVDRRSEVRSADDFWQSLCVDRYHCVFTGAWAGHCRAFWQFSMSAVVSELQSDCPELYKLVQQLGSTQRNARDGTRPDEELKAVMALCTLLNARSARTKDLQLMVSLMLVARATGRQVYTCTIRYAYRYKHVVYIHVCVWIQAMTLLNHTGVCMS